MDRHRRFQFADILIDALDFLNHGSFGIRVNSVCASLNHKRKAFKIHRFLQGNLGAVGTAPPALNLTVYSAAGQHCLLIRHFSCSTGQITAAQKKLHEIPHGNPDCFLLICHIMPCKKFSENAEAAATFFIPAVFQSQVDHCRNLITASLLLRFNHSFVTATIASSRCSLSTPA